MDRFHPIQKGLIVIIILLFLGASVIPSLAEENNDPLGSSSRGTWRYVGGSGPGNYTRIQDAINASADNDTVFVYDDSSPYHENVVLDKAIRLCGEDKNTTIIDGATDNTVVSVIADGVEIVEFTILHSFASPCLTIHANHSFISQNVIGASTGVGIYLILSEGTGIICNTIFNNALVGIRLELCNDNIISGNEIINNSEGLEVLSSAHNQIYYNNFLNNLFNAIDEGNNSWNNEYPSAGNYWDTYTGSDLFWGQNQDVSGADGVGDTPVCISGGMNQDYYPLMEPYAVTRLTFQFLGGFAMSGKIRNIGNSTAFKVCWRMTLSGGFILLGKETLREVPKPLLPGEEATVKSSTILGFGKTTFTMMVWADNVQLISGNWSATVLLFFVLGIRPALLNHSKVGMFFSDSFSS
jgi:parallel beta-helix repeat protein